jgi:hypothetical protein
MNALLSLLYCVTTAVRWLRCRVRLRRLLSSPLLPLVLLAATALPLVALLLLLILQACSGVRRRNGCSIYVTNTVLVT